MNIKCLLLLLTFYLPSPAQSKLKAREFLQKFDLSYYRPQRHGLRNFEVEIRIDGLSQRFDQQLIYGKINDLFFKMSWLATTDPTKQGHKKVKVFGLPKGFVEIKSQLSHNILQKLDFIVPLPLIQKIKDYALTMTTNPKGEHTIVAKDPQNLRPANEIILAFDRQQRLQRFVIKRPTGLETVDLSYSKMPWSRGKWVLKPI